MSESIPQRAERIACDHNITLREARRVAFAESRFEDKRDRTRAERIALILATPHEQERAPRHRTEPIAVPTPAISR